MPPSVSPPLPLPRIALILGWGGVIPFVLAALACLSGNMLWKLQGVIAGSQYAAIILSFVGAVHWGIWIDRPAVTHHYQLRWMIWSVTPALIGFSALMLTPPIKLYLLMLGFALAWLTDRQATRKGYLTEGYMQLRHGLTATAIASLAIMVLTI